MKFSLTTIFLAFIAALCLILFALYHLEPKPLERAKIALHDEQTFKKLQRKHGAHNTRAVVYEADKAYFYNKDGEKVTLK